MTNRINEKDKEKKELQADRWCKRGRGEEHKIENERDVKREKD
jgi:hypothetical protein